VLNLPNDPGEVMAVAVAVRPAFAGAPVAAFAAVVLAAAAIT